MDVGAASRLTRDDVSAGLKRSRVVTERKTFLSREQIHMLLTLCHEHERWAFQGVLFLLLTGVRFGELRSIVWNDVDRGDRIRLTAAAVKTKQLRDIDLSVTTHALPPDVGRHLAERVITAERLQLRGALNRLRAMDARLSDVTPHMLRRTCSTYFTCAFNPWRASKSLGHSVLIAERHYAGLVRVDAGVTTLEQAMGVDVLLQQLQQLQQHSNVRPLRAARVDVGRPRGSSAPKQQRARR